MLTIAEADLAGEEEVEEVAVEDVEVVSGAIASSSEQRSKLLEVLIRVMLESLKMQQKQLLEWNCIQRARQSLLTDRTLPASGYQQKTAVSAATAGHLLMRLADKLQCTAEMVPRHLCMVRKRLCMKVSHRAKFKESNY